MKKIRLTNSHQDSVVTITLDDGKGNILDSLMMQELQQVLDSFRKNTQLKLIVIEGAGKNFSFGASVEEHRKEQAGQMLRSFHNLFYTFRDLAVPTLAKISGQCLGGGMELALACNFLFADRSARLGQPEIVLGVFAPPASILLPLKIGNARAEELLITGRSFTAEEGKNNGLLNELFEDKPAMDAAVEIWIAKNILPKSASSLRYAVKASRTVFNHLLTRMLQEAEQLYLGELMNTHDANEGIASFLEKRKPSWKNC